MKKLLLVFAIFIGAVSLAFSKEIIPEYYVMERLLIPIENSKTYKYVGLEEIEKFKELKAIQVDKNVLKGLGTSEKDLVYIVTGTWSAKDGMEPSANTYGNGFLTDEAGNQITIYGLSSSKSCRFKSAQQIILVS